jgi:microcystin-dependent protein
VQVTPDECVRYTGPTIPALGITTGDTLKTVEQMITDKLVPLLTGVGDQITLGSGDVCALIQTYLTAGLVHTSKDWITALSKGECNLQGQITTINATLATLNADYSIGCLTGVTASSDTHDIVQAIITKLCATAASLTALGLDVSTNYVKLADLNTLIQAYLNSISGGTTQQYTKMVPRVAYEYYGSLSNFDDTGAGIGSLGWDKVYLCNGSNTTPDKRGFVAVGATDIPGDPDSFKPNVNPAYGNPTYSLYDFSGANAITLTPNQMPVHTHTATAISTVTDPGHFHSFSGVTTNSSGTDGAKNSVPATLSTAVATTGITVATNVTNSSAGGNTAHSNIQPVLAAYYIMYIP